MKRYRLSQAVYVHQEAGLEPDDNGEWVRHSEVNERIKLLRAATTWQPIATAPKDGTEILLCVESRSRNAGGMLVGHYMPGGHSISEGWYFWSGSMFDKSSKPTHWMPLPEAAETAEGE